MLFILRTFYEKILIQRLQLMCEPFDKRLLSSHIYNFFLSCVAVCMVIMHLFVTQFLKTYLKEFVILKLCINLISFLYQSLL